MGKLLHNTCTSAFKLSRTWSMHLRRSVLSFFSDFTTFNISNLEIELMH